MVFLLSPTQHPAPHSSGFVHLSGMLRGQFSAFFLSYLHFSEDCLSIFFSCLPPTFSHLPSGSICLDAPHTLGAQHVKHDFLLFVPVY